MRRSPHYANPRSEKLAAAPNARSGYKLEGCMKKTFTVPLALNIAQLPRLKSLTKPAVCYSSMQTCMHAWMAGWLDGWKAGWLDSWMEACIYTQNSCLLNFSTKPSALSALTNSTSRPQTKP